MYPDTESVRILRTIPGIWSREQGPAAAWFHYREGAWRLRSCVEYGVATPGDDQEYAQGVTLHWGAFTAAEGGPMLGLVTHTLNPDEEGLLIADCIRAGLFQTREEVIYAAEFVPGALDMVDWDEIAPPPAGIMELGCLWRLADGTFEMMLVLD